MIKSFRHKGLDQFFFTGKKKGIQPDHSGKIARLLDRLDSSVAANDMNLPGFRLHKLSGKEKDTWSVWVNGNWRITFEFHGEDAYVVDYRDYH
jgi:proteic killer suppression protein